MNRFKRSIATATLATAMVGGATVLAPTAEATNGRELAPSYAPELQCLWETYRDHGWMLISPFVFSLKWASCY